MRVRVIRDPDPTSSQARLAVQRWSGGQWEHVMNFALNEAGPAHEFAMGLSLTKRIPVEMAVFEDGHKVEGGLAPLFVTDNGNGEIISENQS